MLGRAHVAIWASVAFAVVPGAGTLAAAQADAAAEPARDRQVPRIGLREAMQRAIQRNPQSAVAEQEARRLDALVTEQRAAHLPSLSGYTAYTRLDGDREVDGRLLQNADQFTANVQALVPIVAPRSWTRTRQVRDNVQAARFDVVEVRRQLALATAHAYLAVVSRHRVIEVNRRALRNARAHYDFARARYEGQIGNQLDATRAGQEVRSNEATLEASLSDLTQAQEVLGVLVGSDTPLDSAEEFALPSIPDAVDPEAVPNRGDVQAGRQRVRAAHRVLRQTWADYLPSVSGDFVPFVNVWPTPIQPKTGWSAMAWLSLPIAQGGFRVGLKREREALLAQRRAELEAIVRQAKSEVRFALRAIERADAARAAAVRAAELADEALQMANLAYEAGATTNIEVIDAERRAQDAATFAVMAEDTALRVRLDLLSALGRLP